MTTRRADLVIDARWVIPVEPEGAVLANHSVVVDRGRIAAVLATRDGKAIHFTESDARPMGRTARGVNGIRLQKGDSVVSMAVVEPDGTLLTVTDRGYGKRTPLDEYRLQGRAGKGIIDIKTEGRNGSVVGMLQIREGDDILVITTNGKMIRIHGDDITSQGRNTMGVRIIDLDAEDRVGSVARVEAEQAVEPSS